MFNRKLQVDVVKAKKSAPVEIEQTGPTFEEKAVIVTASVERAIKKVGFAVCAYVLLDTIRKVAVASASA